MDYQSVNNAFAFLFLSLGIQAMPSEFLGGLFLAVSGGYFAATWMPPQDRRDIRLMLATALIVSTLSAIIHQKLAPEWPLSFVMGMSGLLSRYAISILLGVSSRIMGKTDQIADGILEEFPESMKKRLLLDERKKKKEKENDEKN